MEHQTEACVETRRRICPGWLKTLLTVVLTLVVAGGSLCLLLGKSGIALLEGWLLSRYVFVDKEADLDGAAEQALSALINGLGDRWSYYMSEEAYRSTVERRANNYVGIGVTVLYGQEEGLLIRDVARGGSAEKAGVLPGEIIVAVDGVSVAGEARYEGADLIQGESGTPVVLTLLAPDGTLRDVTCVRAQLPRSSALRTMLEGNVGYVRLTDFYSNSADSLRYEVESLIAEGAESLIFDVRNNPGGYTEELKEILDFLLPEGPVFVEKSRWGRPQVYESDAACVDLPMVVLVNQNTYSAAELFAAQLRESAGVPIVGEATSGKGYYQLTFMLPNGGGIGLSSGTYYTGAGHSLIGVGIVPDVQLELSAEVDTQLQAALDLLK